MITKLTFIKQKKSKNFSLLGVLFSESLATRRQFDLRSDTFRSV